MRVAIVGAGISGLTAAYRLGQQGHEAIVYEAADRPGGKIHSERDQGFIVEWAANGVLSGRTHVFELAVELGLEPLPADHAAEKRYLFDGERLRALPKSPPAFLKSDLVSRRARLRALAEPLIRRGTGEEAVHGFLRRRFGRGVADGFADLAVLGIYAGDPHQLSLDAAFPFLRDLEREHGSVIKGMIARKRQGGGLGRLTGFKDGMGALITALAERVDVRLGHRVEALADLDADHVIVAVPPPQAARLLEPIAPVAAEALRGIPMAPIAAMVYGVPTTALPRPLDGFGCLIPPHAGRNVIGVVWTSAVFPSHAPDGMAALRVLVGGVRQGHLIDQDDAAFTAMVRADLSAILGGPMPAPAYARIVRWPEGIPQYTLGHGDRLARIEAALPPQLALAGNGLYGASVADCVARGEALAHQISTSNPTPSGAPA